MTGLGSSTLDLKNPLSILTASNEAGGSGVVHAASGSNTCCCGGSGNRCGITRAAVFWLLLGLLGGRGFCSLGLERRNNKERYQ